VPFYQCDASAIVKRYVTEVGSGWVQALCDPAASHTIGIAEITRAEVASALQRRVREGSIPTDVSAELIRSLEAHSAMEYRLVPTDHTVISLAVALIQRHPLRAYDAVQLATALHVNETLVSIGLPAIVFVSGDADLLSAALAEGLAIENPNDRP
jgi:predicted nucleic acid-binding protein